MNNKRMIDPETGWTICKTCKTPKADHLMRVDHGRIGTECKDCGNARTRAYAADLEHKRERRAEHKALHSTAERVPGIFQQELERWRAVCATEVVAGHVAIPEHKRVMWTQQWLDDHEH